KVGRRTRRDRGKRMDQRPLGQRGVEGRINDGVKRIGFALPALHSPAFTRNFHRQPVKIGAKRDLAGQTAGRGHARGQIEHVFLVGAGGFEARKPVGRNEHMTRRTGHLPLAGALKRHARRLRHFKQALTGAGLRLDTLPPCCDELHLDHYVSTPIRLWRSPAIGHRLLHRFASRPRQTLRFAYSARNQGG
ncbi:hypothetical protein E4T56_gene17337, partial [Termitomyces sp. T112]